MDYQKRRWQHRIMRLDSACREALAVLWRQVGPEAVEALFDRPLLTLDRVALTEITRSAFWRDVLLPLDRPTKVAPFFDVEFYMRQHPPVELRRLTPLAHYVLFGAGEGRKPHPFFDPTWYLARNPDIVSSGANPLQHFVNQGYEGKRPHPAIPDTWYRSAYGSPRRNDPIAQAVLPPLPIPQRRYAIHDLTRAHAATPGPRRPVVCISHVLPSRPRAGNEYRISRMLDWLAACGHEVVVVVAPLEIDEPDAAERQLFFQKYQNAIICCRSGTVFASSGPLRFSLAALQQQRIGDVVGQLASDKSDEACNRLETNFCHEALIGRSSARLRSRFRMRFTT